MNIKQQKEFDKIMKNCHLPTRLDMTHLIKNIEQEARKEFEEIKLEILKEFQRQMLKRNYNVKEVFEISEIIREKYNIKFGEGIIIKELDKWKKELELEK